MRGISHVVIRYFLILVGGIGLMTTLCLVLTVYFLVESFTLSQRFTNRRTSNHAKISLSVPPYTHCIYVYLYVTSRLLNAVSECTLLDGVLNRWTAVGLLFVSASILVPLVALVFQLGGFHSMLGQCTTCITYTYIMTCLFLRYIYPLGSSLWSHCFYALSVSI